MLVKVIGSAGVRNFNEIFNLPDNAKGSALRKLVSEELEGAEVELFCMGRVLGDQDNVPSGCVLHMRTVLAKRPDRIQIPPEPHVEGTALGSSTSPDSDSERDPADAEDLYDEDAGVEQILGQNWNDPQAIAQYRRRVEERGLNADEVQRKLAETLIVIRKYQHYVAFYVLVILLELIAWPPLCNRIPDLGTTQDSSDDEDKGWLNSLNIFNFDFISGLNFMWWVTIIVSIIVIVGVCCADVGTGMSITIHRMTQWFWILLNVYYLVASGFKLWPFKDALLKGSWVAVSSLIVVITAFRVVRIYVSYRYMRFYKSLGLEERKYAHKTILVSLLTGQLAPAAPGAAPQEQQPGQNPGLQMV